MAQRTTRAQRQMVAEMGERRALRQDLALERRHRRVRQLIVILVVLAVLLVVALVGYLVLSSTSAFTIKRVVVEETEHLSSENIEKLASIDERTTLLTIDEDAVTESLRRNPWVGSVSYAREFPDTLRIVVSERRVGCLVKMNTGSVCWCLGDDQVWIEPVNLTVRDGQSADDTALALAKDMGVLLVSDVPSSVSPTAGSDATDEVLRAVAAYREQFSDEFNAQVVRFSAPSVESISCTLGSGVEVSLGSPSSIEVKESVVREILEKHPNQVTYINVRVPSQPSYRKLGVDSVSEGTGVTVETPDDSDVQSVQDAQTDASTTQGGDGSPQGESATPAQGADGSAATAEGRRADGQELGDTSELILGDDGYYYTYEQYYGLDEAG